MVKLVPGNRYKIMHIHPNDAYYDNKTWIGLEVIYRSSPTEKPEINKFDGVSYMSGTFELLDENVISNERNNESLVYFYGVNLKYIVDCIHDPLERINQKIKERI